MAFLELYQNLSNFSLYKAEIYKAGVNSLLVFNLDGIPFIARDYSNDNVRTSQDFIFLSAFISSILKFIRVEGNYYITDFGIGTSRFYLRFDQNQTIYCLVLNEIIHRRITGDELISFVEDTTTGLEKVFNSYHNDNSGILKKDKYDEKFCLRIDRVFLSSYEKYVSNAFKTNFKSSFKMNNELLDRIKSEKHSSVNSKLTDLGIKGLIVCGCGGDKPVIIRNYQEGYVKNTNGGYFICGLSHILNKFALNNFGFFTDVGFGFERVIFKFKTENGITLCLILSELLYKKVTGETLNIFSELMLTRVHQSITILPDLVELPIDLELKSHNNEMFETLDNIMIQNALSIYRELQN